MMPIVKKLVRKNEKLTAYHSFSKRVKRFLRSVVPSKPTVGKGTRRPREDGKSKLLGN